MLQGKSPVESGPVLCCRSWQQPPSPPRQSRKPNNTLSLAFVICHLSFVICQFVICHLPFAKSLPQLPQLLCFAQPWYQTRFGLPRWLANTLHSTISHLTSSTCKTANQNYYLEKTFNTILKAETVFCKAINLTYNNWRSLLKERNVKSKAHCNIVEGRSTGRYHGSIQLFPDIPVTEGTLVWGDRISNRDQNQLPNK